MSWATLERVTVDGVRCIVKHTDYDARLEANGLEALRRAGAPVPRVVAVDEHGITMTEVSGPGDWYELGATLARVHRHTADAFGYHQDNVIGPLSQANPWTPQWGSYFAETRVLAHLDDPAIPGAIAHRLRTACTGPLPLLLDEHRPVPSLIHGDLWTGNIVGGAWLIDPAVSYSDREAELAFLALFGGVPDAMWSGYHDTWPLDRGWQHRRPALQLHHLLVHVRLFGGGYAAMVAERLDRLGW